jgi:hypothetical protein
MDMNPVDYRLGRRRKAIAQPTANAERKRKLEVVNRLVTENNWRGDLARSVKDVIDIDDCQQVYGEQYAAK